MNNLRAGEEPVQPVIVYDGECRFCLWSVQRIRKLDRPGLFEYVPRQARGVAERFPALAGSDFNTGLRLIQDGGQVHVGADAVYEIYRRLSPYRFFAWVYRLPVLRQLFRAAYALVARNRHRFGKVRCVSEACGLGDAPTAPDAD